MTLLGLYLEAISDLKWLSADHVANARVKFNRGEFRGTNTDFAPKPAEVRKLVVATHEQRVTDEATRISGYLEGDWANREADPEARKRSDLRMKLFSEFKELNAFDAPALEAKANTLALTHVG